MARAHVLAPALALAAAAAPQEPPPAADPVQQRANELVDRFHRVMPRDPVDLRQAAVRRERAADALPALRDVRTFVQQHPDTALGRRGLEFTIWSLVLGDDTAAVPLRAQQAAGDGASQLLLASSAVIGAADEPQRAAAIAAVAKALASARAPASEAAATSAVSCLLMAADLSGAEAGALAKSAAMPALARRLDAAARAAARDPRLLLGKPVELTGTLVSGEPFSTAALRGKVVLVDFWATWCGPCVRALPELVQARRKHGARGLEVVGVSSDRDRGALERFLRERPELDWPQLFSPGSTAFHPLAEQFGVTAIPRLFLIDRRGMLRSVDAHGRLDELVVRLLDE